ncbi:DUF72 domain-containing protein [Cupriavidus agavae]|uniref:Uncharacterized protein YecE (DUF72 family) n=1 Tax=Cupriavidus agavae TaxID=1001822 RepID=A0A4Q7RRM0_9BURK|nr:DUF72 domain-containing protein [Cupriavidus agavae]RZT35438.1 uncharacterized protein YecE (DUF72 family) [Cupriavidus agavae]
MTVRIGISGWRYAGWRGVFYPAKLPQRCELFHASQHVDTIEINGSHYSLQSIESWQAWHDTVAGNFVFAVKGPRYLTHQLRFRDEKAIPAMANFYASGVLALRRKLGPFLWQFPPNFMFDAERFDRFLSLLPKNTREARALAAQHDTRVESPWYRTTGNSRLRHAVEVRHDSFRNAEFPAMLREHRVALVVSHAIADWPYAEDVTSDFIYMRLHGADTLYGGSYSDVALDRWAARIHAWSQGKEPPDAIRIGPGPARTATRRDVFCYFDNDKKVHAPFDAQRLRQRVPGTVLPAKR